MIAILNILNSAFTKLFAVIFAPLRMLSPFWAMTIFSIVAGLIMVYIFGKTSNQTAIGKVKDQIRGNLIAVRLFQDDLMVLMRLQGKILRHTLKYMGYSLAPMIVMLIPMVFVITQLNLRFSRRPLAPGESALVKVKVQDAKMLDEPIALEADGGVNVETAGVRIPGEREIAWRIRAETEGKGKLTVRRGETEEKKDIVVGKGWGAVSELREGKSATRFLLYPGESPLPKSSGIETIQVTYPALPISILGFNVNWLVLFFIVSVVFGYACKGLMGVEA